MKYVLIGLLKVYRAVVSPLYGDVCKFHPTCSAYALGAVETHRALKGSVLTIRRLVRCHPGRWAGTTPFPAPNTREE